MLTLQAHIVTSYANNFYPYGFVGNCCSEHYNSVRYFILFENFIDHLIYNLQIHTL
jgi:hypothetical protein